MSYDERCEELARVFMGDIRGASLEDARILAQAIQDVCEAHCYEVEARVSAHEDEA
ncbi:MAG: hypothetical protein AB7O04_16820 [Hyphomonadaceae bacterium]